MKVVVLLWLALFFVCPAMSFGRECALTVGQLETQQYTVNRIRFNVPLAWLGSVQAELDKLKGTLPLKEKALFSQAPLLTSLTLIQDELGRSETAGVHGVEVSVVKPSFKNCKLAGGRGLVDVVFNVYALDFGYYRSLIFERKKDELFRAPVPTGLVNFLKDASPQPFIGYDRSRHTFAGAGITVDDGPPVVRNMRMEGEGSSSSARGKGSLDGSHDFASGFLKHLEWEGGYEYSDMPAEALQLKRSNFYAHMFGASRPFGGEEGDRSLILRFGASAEGGNRQTDFNSAIALAPSEADARHGAIKTYVGGSLRIGRHDLKASYGLQAAKAGEGARVDYMKHLFDSAYAARFLPANNYPISVEAQLTAGKINRLGGNVPIAERFFGGSNEHFFIPEDRWRIRSGPFIRSFPTNGLNEAGPGVLIGGESFLSLNFTAAATVWAKPLVPREIQPEVLSGFGNKLVADALRFETAFSYVTETPAYPALVASVGFDALETRLTAVVAKMDDLLDETLTPEAQRKVSTCSATAELALDFVLTGKENLAKNNEITQEVHELVVGFPRRKPPTPAEPELVKVARCLDELIASTDPVLVAERPTLQPLKDAVMASFDPMSAAYQTYRASPQGFPLALAKADRDLEFVRSSIEKLVTEVNIASVGPVFMFDMARLRAEGLPRPRGFRYGVGPGVRAEFFGTSLTFGYSFNPDRRPGERKGAFTFSFDVLDLVR